MAAPGLSFLLRCGDCSGLHHSVCGGGDESFPVPAAPGPEEHQQHQGEGAAAAQPGDGLPDRAAPPQPSQGQH